MDRELLDFVMPYILFLRLFAYIILTKIEFNSPITVLTPRHQFLPSIRDTVPRSLAILSIVSEHTVICQHLSKNVAPRKICLF